MGTQRFFSIELGGLCSLMSYQDTGLMLQYTAHSFLTIQSIQTAQPPFSLPSQTHLRPPRPSRSRRLLPIPRAPVSRISLALPTFPPRACHLFRQTPRQQRSHLPHQHLRSLKPGI